MTKNNDHGMTERIDTASPYWFSAVEAAEMVADSHKVVWDDEADLVIVGYGGAGVAAAIEGAEGGLEVLAIDRFEGGGSTAINGGIIYAGGGTIIQKSAGFNDKPEEMFKYLKLETEGVVLDRTLKRFCDTSATMLDWLIARGVKFNDRFYSKKTGYPDPAYYLYYSDNSLAPSRKVQAKPAPRGHRVFTPPLASGQYGRFIYEPLRATASKLGVRFMPQSEVTQLIIDKSGRVLGIKLLQIPPNTEAWHKYQHYQGLANRLMVMLPAAFPGYALTFRLSQRYQAKAAELNRVHRVARRIGARVGVCLSGGGFIYNRPLVTHLAPHHEKTVPMGNPGDDGSSIRLGQTAGGATSRMGRICSWRFLNPPGAWIKGMIVNQSGQRFVDETLYASSIGYFLNEEQGGVGYLIMDATLNRAAWRELFFTRMLGYQRYPGIFSMLFAKHKARSIEGLAAKCGLDAAALKRSIEAYNRACAGHEADPYMKDRAEMSPILKAPYYALDISGSNNLLPMMAMTLGGLKVDEESGGVLREDGSKITGLYAAGRAAIGICSNVYMSGLSVADCIFSGRRVGSHLSSPAHAKGHEAADVRRPTARVK